MTTSWGLIEKYSNARGRGEVSGWEGESKWAGAIEKPGRGEGGARS